MINDTYIASYYVGEKNSLDFQYMLEKLSFKASSMTAAKKKALSLKRKVYDRYLQETKEHDTSPRGSVEVRVRHLEDLLLSMLRVTPLEEWKKGGDGNG